MNVTPLPVNDRYATVSAPAKAFALDIQTAANRLALDLGGRFATEQGRKDADVQLDALEARIADLRAEL